MNNIFQDEQTEAVSLVDVANAFNEVNHKSFLHNINIICPSIAAFVHNCYSRPNRLFVIGGVEIASSEGTTQGDPVAMAVYAIAIIPFILIILEITESYSEGTSKAAAYADDLTAAGCIPRLKYWWDQLYELGPKFGYFPQASKSCLIIRPEVEGKAKTIFQGSGVQITTEGKRHLGTLLGSTKYKEEYLSSKVDEWIAQLRILSQIARTQTQAEYRAFITGSRHKISFYMRTISVASTQLKRLDEVVQSEFIPAITGGVFCNEMERKLIVLPLKLGGLGITIFTEISNNEFENSIKLTECLSTKIINQMRQYEPDEEIQAIKNRIHAARVEQNKQKLDVIRSHMNSEQLRTNDLNQETVASAWLTTLPLKQEGYALTKQLFWDRIRIRYGWQLSRTPEFCECGIRFSLQNA